MIKRSHCALIAALAEQFTRSQLLRAASTLISSAQAAILLPPTEVIVPERRRKSPARPGAGRRHRPRARAEPKRTCDNRIRHRGAANAPLPTARGWVLIARCSSSMHIRVKLGFRLRPLFSICKSKKLTFISTLKSLNPFG
jgi:hypothetical protein